MPSQPTTSGIITDAAGERQIPASTRADGSTRRAIKIRPGYRPPEDVELYKNRTAESFRNRQKGGVPGAEAVTGTVGASGAGGVGAAGGSAASAAANKNAKRREARKKAAAAAADEPPEAAATTSSAPTKANPPAAPVAVVDPALEREKKARGLKKKLKQAKELQNKRDDGEALLPEQIAKVIRISELIRELDALGFDAEGEDKNEQT